MRTALAFIAALAFAACQRVEGPAPAEVPGAEPPAPAHAGSAFIYAHVLSGSIRSQVNDEPARVYQVGEGFHEVPGSHHRVSENASESEPASLLAVFIVDAEDDPLTVPDPK